MANFLKRLRETLGQPEGIATGLGAGFVFGPAVGLGLGLVQGILAKRMRDGEADDIRTTAELDASLEEQLGGLERFSDQETDAAQLQNLQRRRAHLVQLATASSDPKVRSKAMQDLVDLSAGVQGFVEDTEGRREGQAETRLAGQRAIITDLAKGLRTKYEGAITKRRELQANAGQIHELLNEPGFDPNKPLNRGRLIDLMRSSSRTILADPADFGDALARSGAPGAIGSILQLLGGAMKADEFRFTKAEWRALAVALYDAETRQFGADMERVESGVAELELPAHELGILPADFGLAQYVLGQVEDFPRPYSSGEYPEIADSSMPPADLPEEEKRAPLWTGKGAFYDFMRGLKRKADEATERNRRRPTN